MTKMLIVDDSKFALNMLSGIVLKVTGDMEVFSYRDAPEALELVVTGELAPDCAIVDYNMPEINGLEVIGKLLEYMPASRIALLTSDGAFLEDGGLKPPEGTLFLSKPITEDKLKSLISQMGV